MAEDNYKILLKNLDSFIKKYYRNKILKGLAYFFISLIFFFLAFVLLEKNLYFNKETRGFLFYFFIIINFIVLIKTIVIPFLKSLKLAKSITYDTSAEIIIKTLCDEVDDSLKNVLELQKILKISAYSEDLIKASIKQKSKKLNKVSFKKAIDFKATIKKYRYYYLIVILFLTALIISPNIFVKPANRIIKYKQSFAKPMPFTFVILNDSLYSETNENFKLQVSTKGNVIPDEIYIFYKKKSFKLNKISQNLFNYDFINLQDNLSFKLFSGNYFSENYYLNVLPKPYILDFQAEINYPKYIKKKREVLQNTGDFIVPEGTNISWTFNTQQANKLNFNFDNKLDIIRENNDDVFFIKKKVFKSLKYSVCVENDYVKNYDSLFFNITILADLFPEIKIQRQIDSVFLNKIYFHGFIKDDYGFTNLKFKCEKLDDITNTKKLMFSENIKILNNQLKQDFYYYYDFKKFDLETEDRIQYYFEVTDNDGVKGGKISKSDIFYFKKLSLKEKREKFDTATDNIKNKMNDFLKKIDSQKKKIDKLKNALIEKEKLSWQEKNLLKDILKKQEDLQKKYQEIKQENKNNNFSDNDESDSEILKKREQLEQLFEEVLDEKTKKQIDEFQEKLKDIDKSKVQKMLDELKMNNKDIEKQLERNLEIFKNLEFEKKLNQIVDDLDKIAKSQKDVSEKKKDNKNKDKSLESQKDLNKDFNDIKKNIDELEKKNKDLESPNKLEDSEKQEDEISDDMKNALENLESGKNKKATKNQKNASQKMQKLSSLFKKMQSQMSMQAMGEDIQSLRNILESLIQLSFDQENLISDLRKISLSNPKFSEIINKQKSFKDDLVLVSDSLYSLSKRQPSIKPYVFREIENINTNIDRTMQYLIDAQVSIARGKQQNIMTSVNNLALIISEYLKNMQNQNSMMSSGKPSSSCPKPGSGQSPIKTMQQLQQQLNSQMQQMKNEKSQGGKSGKGKSKMAEKLARMAAQQQAIREKMQDLMSEMQGENAGNSRNLNLIIKKMESTETDIINNKISRQTLIRQKDIMTRLLKSDKAMRKKEFEKKRLSETANAIKNSQPKKLIEIQNNTRYKIDFLEKIPASLKPFYKSKANEYFYYLHKKN